LQFSVVYIQADLSATNNKEKINEKKRSSKLPEPVSIIVAFDIVFVKFPPLVLLEATLKLSLFPTLFLYSLLFDLNILLEEFDL
jgi:hypothetical protein